MCIRDRTIGESAFSCCFGMTELKLPESIAKIGNKAFYGCVNLEKIAVSDKCNCLLYTSHAYTHIRKNIIAARLP